MKENDIMTKTINTLVSSALAAAGAYGTSVASIRTALKGQLSPDAVRAALLAPVAAFYGVTLVAKERGEGVTWDKDAAKYETAKKAHQRLVKDVMGKVESQSEALDVPAHIAKLAAQLVVACGEYEGTAKLIATAIANAKAAK